MAIYESEYTKFMRDWIAQHPEEAEVKETGRALWWDKAQTLDAQKRYRKVAVPVKPYYYDVH